MSITTPAVVPSDPVPAPRLLTAADLAALPDDLPSGGVRWELDDGRLVVLPLPTYSHAAASSTVSAHLMI
jgi:Uma2 family endonuclease